MIPLVDFLEEFVVPLMTGGAVRVRAPFSSRDRTAFLIQAGDLAGDPLRLARERRARVLVAEPVLPDPGLEELSMWLALHNMLFFDHPDVERIWARGSRWGMVEEETAKLLTFAHPTDMGDAFTRHLALGPFLDLERVDHIVRGPEGERRYAGRNAPRGWFGPAGEEEVERVRWLDQPHATPVVRLLAQAFHVSPLTALLRPAYVPEHWSPLSGARFLQNRAFVRATCHAWAREPDWITVGAILTGSLLRSLGLAESAPPTALVVPDDGEGPRALAPAADDPSLAGPREVGAVVGALVHLHVLKVVELDARVGLGVGTRDRSVQAFLALPLLLRHLRPALGDPFAGLEDDAVLRRWAEYVEHLRGLVPRPMVENLVDGLVPRIVERPST